MPTPILWRNAARHLRPYRLRLSVVCLAAAVLVVADFGIPWLYPNYGKWSTFIVLFGLGCFLLVEAWGLLLVTYWFRPDAARTAVSTPRAIARQARDWYAALFLVVWFISGFVFLFAAGGMLR